MNIEAKLVEDMKSAMKAGEKLRLETIRMLRSHLKNAAIEKGEELTDEEQQKVLKSAAKRGRDSIEQFKQGGRDDRAEEEAAQVAIIETYLPEQMSEAEVTKVVDVVITELNASSMQDMGKVMGAVMGRLKGQADGKIVQQIVRQQLSQG